MVGQSAMWWAPALLLVAFAGCIGSEDTLPSTNDLVADPPADLPVGLDHPYVIDGIDLRKALTAEDQLGAPTWVVGEWFGHHVFFGLGDDAGLHINTVVTRESASQWFMAAANPEIAAVEAIFDAPLLGEFSKEDLATTGFGGAWRLLDFPLYDGKTWSGQFKMPSFMGEGAETLTLSYEASFDPSISTSDGKYPGFDIEARTPEGEVLMQYDFVPQIGWYAHFYFYDLNTERTDDYVWHVMSMGHGYEWTGTWYVHEATSVLSHNEGMAPNPDNPAESWIAPEPAATFVVSDAAEHLWGFTYAWVVGGHHKTFLIDPNNEVRQYEAQDISLEAGEGGSEIFEPAIAGTWTFGSAGAGVAHGGGGFIWELDETTGTL